MFGRDLDAADIACFDLIDQRRLWHLRHIAQTPAHHSQKTENRKKLAGKIELLHEVIEAGLKQIGEPEA